MNFLRKPNDQIAQHLGLRYPNDRKKAVEILMHLQKGFCAYSERYLKPLDSVELEHFDPRKKNTPNDGIENWHAVIRWMNAHKARKIENYEPLPDLENWDSTRVWYDRGLFVCREDDREAHNLIEFLGVNRQEVFEERAKHIARLKNLLEKAGVKMLLEILEDSPDQMDFPSAIQAELGIAVFDLIANALGSNND
jgi:hypothetical protein